MPVYTPQAKQSVFNGSSTEDGGPKGQRATFLFSTQGRGVPRRDELLTIRALEESHAVALPIDTIKTQITTTPFTFHPPGEIEPTTAHNEGRDDLLEWFDGNFSERNQTFDHFLKEIVGDLLSIDAGVVEKVPDDDGMLEQIYPRDGATFVKNPDEHDRLPRPEDDEPAYYQFSLSSTSRVSADKPVGDLFDEVSDLGYSMRAHAPIGFTRDEIAWLEESPKTWKSYGTGRVQKVRSVAESVLNMDFSNRKHFDTNEIPEGVLSVIDANQSDIERTREYWKEEIEGSEHKLPILGGDTEYQSFRASPTELNFLESQNWYHKLIWMIFGLSQSEVGLIEDVNRSAHTAANTAVWRKTTKPLLQLIEQWINAEILPYHRVYHRLDGEIRFSWNYENPAVEEQRRKQQRQALENGTTTINEVRQERGNDPKMWGDWPLELVRSTARNHPTWFLEQLGVEDPPSGGLGGGDPLGLALGGGDAGARDGAGDQGNPNGAGSDDAGDGAGAGLLADRLGLKDEPLRNEPYEGDKPPLAAHVDDLKTSVSARYTDQKDDLKDAIEDVFPDERLEEAHDERRVTKGIAVDVESIIAQVGLARVLTGVVQDSNLEAMGIAADFEAGELEEALEDQLDEDDADVSIGFDVEDSNARRHMERRAAQNMVTVEQTVKDRIGNTLLDVADDGGNVNDATQALDETFDELTADHSRLVARTETLSSSRYGSQALAETSDVVGGKQWIATQDGRTRTWHEAMHEVIELVDDDFVVPDVNEREDEHQPPDYPRTATVVGEDQPFNCRCIQRSVLEEDLPDDMRELAAIDGVEVKVDGEPVEPLSERQIEVKHEHAQQGETFAELLERTYDDVGSVAGLKRELGIGSKHTVYKWLDDADVDR